MYGFELEEMLGLGEANAISKKDLKEDPFFQEKHKVVLDIYGKSFPFTYYDLTQP